jgi:type IV pilus assembly protein PilP
VKRHAVAALACLSALAFACGDTPPAGPTAADLQAERERLLAQVKPESEQAAPETGDMLDDVAELASRPRDSFTYNPKGRRDPFQSYRHDSGRDATVQTPLMAYELEQLAVVAVVWDAQKRRALISDPRGETHVVKEGSPIGKNDGLVIHIGDNMVLVKETYVDFAGEMTTKDVELRIRRSQGG